MGENSRPRTFNRRGLLAAGGLSLALPTILAACGGGSNGGSDGSDGGGEPQTGPRATEGTIDNDGVVRIGAVVATSNVFPENFNVFGGGDSAPGNGLFWETLFRVSSTDGSALVPHLAESVEYNAEGTEATYKLRNDVTWNDGTPFTAKDVAFTYNFVFGDAGTEPDEDGNLPWLVKPVEAVDEHTVVVTYNEPQFTQDIPMSLYYPVYPEHIYKDVDRATYQDKRPVGTGPGIVKEFAGQQITIEICDAYWGEISDDVKEIHIVPAGTAGNIESQITQGQVDWAEGGAPGVVNNFVGMDEHNGYYYFPDGSTRSIILATHMLPTSDLAVRQALRGAVDMNIVAQAGGIGYTVPSVTGLDTIIYESMLKDEFSEPMMPDVEAAKKALEEAGWTIEGGHLTKDGESHPLKLHIQNDNPAEMSTMPVVIDQWRENLGLEVEFTPLPPEVFGPLQAKGECHMSLWTTNAAGGAFQAFTMYMHTKIYDLGDEKADGNYGRWEMPDEANDAIMGITKTPGDDTEQITAHCQTLQQAVFDEVPYIPVQSNGAGGMFTTKKWSGLKPADEIDYFPRVGGYNNVVKTLSDFSPTKS